jgi:hypothetical protein
MEAVAIIGLMSNVLEFMDHRYKFVTFAKNIYDSTTGKIRDHERLEEFTTSMQELSTRLDVKRPGAEQSDDERNLSRLALDCRKLAEETLLLLRKTKAKKEQSFLESAKAAFRTMLKKDEIMKMERRLDQCQSQLDLQLTVMMRFA